ncbi:MULTISPECIES: hypothetical protein [Pseudomonadati]|uniref:Uncharacterized protein n=1 Tax=Shewanella aestuarii TaxID=1028752 RepID=A0ABT0L1U3_9GAMM|nr:hypothetical protein [Shewanella aestuarii]MCL1117684.1 hypothetical protein [Shewanella aestuarii]GGN76472.1 hypothetical protein GCM10009193_17790 [Shewanella aestuarii]
MKNWLNKIIGRTSAPTRNKVKFDLHYHSHSFTMEDFKNASEEIEMATRDNLEATVDVSNEVNSAASNNSDNDNLTK